MNKLGFAIKLASQGASNAIECNKGQWTNKVVDIREYLKLFSGLMGTDNIVTFISFDEGGCFLTQLRAIPGRIGDFLSGWIYIPNTIEVTGDDIMSAYRYVRSILSKSSLNDDIYDIQSFFSKEYPRKGFVVSYNPSTGEEYGVRYCDEFYSLKEILDTDRYQPYYSKYKAIFLLSKDSEISIAKEQIYRFKNLTKETIDKYCIFKAPSPQELCYLGQEVRLVLPDGQEFKSHIVRRKGEQVQLFAVRDGFEPIPIPMPLTTIEKDGQQLHIDFKTLKWMKRITSSMFVVCKNNKEPIDMKNILVLTINGNDVLYGDSLISEEDCRCAIVKVRAEGYDLFEQNLNILNGPCKIVLNRKIRSVQTFIELGNGYQGTMTIESRYLSSNSKESPLKGYVYDELNKILRLSPLFVWKQRLLGFCAALVGVSFLLAVWVVYPLACSLLEKVGFSFNQKNTEQFDYRTVTDEFEKKENTNEDDSISGDESQNAIAYLNGNTNWNKYHLEHFEVTKGLFDALNMYDFEKINSFADNFPECESLQNIKNVMSMHPEKLKNAEKYNRDENVDIIIDEYVQHIKALVQSERKETKKTPSKGNDIKRGGI